MQYLNPVGSGPSLKTCPRWASHRLHFTSVRRMPWLRSSSSSTNSAFAGAVKLGHPHPESNFDSDRNNGCPQHTHLYVPAVWVPSYSPVWVVSFPFCRVT